MYTINELIINYNILVQNQNNHYIFTVGEKPYILLKNFVKNNLEPPLILIKELYNSIEEKLTDEILKIADNFPDYYSIIKEKLYIESRINNLTYFFEEINSTLTDYKETINNDFDEYFIQLVHFSFINGLEKHGPICVNSTDCANYTKYLNNITNNADELKNEINNENNDYNYIYNSSGISSLKRKINKIIDLDSNIKYDSSKGSLSKDDLLYYLSLYEKTLYSLNGTYLNNDFKNIKKAVNKFITKINMTYLIKLEKSFSMTLLKFSTILTENSYEKLKKNVYKQYYNISEYIYEKSNDLNNETDSYIDKINKTSFLIEIIDSLVSYRILSYYDLINDAIQNSFSHLGTYKLRRRNEYDIEKFLEHHPAFDYYLKNFKEIFNAFKLREIKRKIKDMIFMELYQNLVSPIISNTLNQLFNKIKKTYKSEKFKTWEQYLPPIPFPLFPFLQLRIKPALTIGYRTEIKIFEQNEDELYTSFDTFVQGKTSISFEIGIYIPGASSAYEISICVGITGVLGAGKIGMKVNLYYNTLNLKIDIYYVFSAFDLNFYVLFKITIDLKFVSFKFEFYIVNQYINGISKEHHNIKIYSLS